MSVEAPGKPDAKFHIVVDRCTGCGYCRLVCPAKAVIPPPRSRIDSSCVGCGKCLRACPNNAIEVDR